MHARSRRGLAAALAIATAVSGGVLLAAPAPDASAATEVTITPNPGYRLSEFQGWGTSLVWFANATGDYPPELRQELFDRLFGEEGLDLNVARYNIGGGNASDVPDYLRPGAAVEGWWAEQLDPAAGATSTYDDRADFLAEWDANDPASYDFSADATQRWWVDAIDAEQGDEMVWEAFSNSPPYFMTNSGFATGSFRSTDESVIADPAVAEAFATYLATVVAEMESEHGIDFQTLAPFNEPCNGYWGTSLPAGQQFPSLGGRTQEGAQICPGPGPGQQQAILAEVEQALVEAGLDTSISSNDETNPGRFNQAWSAYGAEARDDVDQINVHTYGTNGRELTRDIARAEGLPLWMSEVGGNWVSGSGFDPLTIEGGLGIAQHITNDLRILQPDAYVLWQEVEDLYNMEQVERLNWGSVFIDFDCAEPGTEGYSVRRLADAGWTEGEALPESARCQVVTNSKFDTLRNFTHYIQPGSTIIATDDAQTTSAITPDGEGAAIVHVNAGEERVVTLDLSRFGAVAPGATVTPVVTTEADSIDAPSSNALEEGAPVAIDPTSMTATLTVPAASVTTFVVDGVSGVADDALAFDDGDAVALAGVQSGLPLSTQAPASSGNALSLQATATTAEAAAAQAFTFHAAPAAPGRPNDLRYAIQASDGRFLAAGPSGTQLVAATQEQAIAQPSTTWVATTRDGETFSFLNVGTSTVLDVNGQGRTPGTAVGMWTTGDAANQRWQPRVLEALGAADVVVQTPVGVAPTLPETVEPIYAWGAGAPVPVTWDVAGLDWAQPGTVVVPGTATDLYGRTIAVEATVEVGAFTRTDPVSLTVVVGTTVAELAEQLPTTVPARVGASASTFDVPVVWDLAGIEDAALAAPGVVDVAGTADASGAELPAQLAVLVTEGVPANLLTLPGVVASATFTEPGYSADATRNGDATDKGWSNWLGGTKRPSDTLSYVLAEPATLVDGRVHFFRDGTSWASTVQPEARVDGVWTPVGAPVPVEVPASGPPTASFDLDGVRADAVRVVMTAQPNTHMVVAEVEVRGLQVGPASTAALAALRTDGEPVEGFDPDVLEYRVASEGSAYPRVDAIALDAASTVVVTQATDERGGIAEVVVTSADGASTQTTTVAFDRSAVVTGTELVGEAIAGRPVAVAAATDPADATIAVRWLLDGEPIEAAGDAQAAVSDAVVLPADAVGARLTAEVVASAEGFGDSDVRVLDAGIVQAAPVEPEPEAPNPGEPGQPGQPGPGQPGAPAPGQPGQPAQPGAGSGALPTTGAEQGVLPALLVLAGALAAVGAALWSSQRRSRRA
ncbi:MULTISPECIES: Ig-like domain-containing protein [unclassified Agrococcus]|uniref:Ig-like domain-containing protein n=1 Tax=unclassified Agrococcus TaxID=2615065 RepID=UPI0036234C82